MEIKIKDVGSSRLCSSRLIIVLITLMALSMLVNAGAVGEWSVSVWGFMETLEERSDTLCVFVLTRFSKNDYATCI